MQLAGWSMIEASFPLCSISYGALILLLMLLLRFLDIFLLELFVVDRYLIPQLPAVFIFADFLALARLPL